MTAGQEIEPGLERWQASALTTAPTLSKTLCQRFYFNQRGVAGIFSSGASVFHGSVSQWDHLCLFFFQMQLLSSSSGDENLQPLRVLMASGPRQHSSEASIVHSHQQSKKSELTCQICLLNNIDSFLQLW